MNAFNTSKGTSNATAQIIKHKLSSNLVHDGHLAFEVLYIYLEHIYQFLLPLTHRDRSFAYFRSEKVNMLHNSKEPLCFWQSQAQGLPVRAAGANLA